MKLFPILALLLLAGCSATHQDLKAPYEIDPMVPVLNQWTAEDTDHE